MINKPFSYWTRESKKSVDGEPVFLFIPVSENEVKKLEDELEKASALYDKLESEIADIQSQMDSENPDEQSSLRTEILKKRAEQSKAKANKASLHTKIDNCNAIKMISFEIQRLKDRYLYTEALSIENFINGKENGKVITSPAKIMEDIYKFENFGVSMTPICFDALAKGIKDSYFELTPVNKEFIENDIPRSAVKMFASICYSHIQEKEKEQEALYQASIAKGKNFEKETYDSDQPNFYDVPVSDFKSWYADSAFCTQNITHMKEALKIHKYISCNAGRLDFTIIAKKGAKKGSAVKVMRFCKDKLENLAPQKDN